MVKIILLLIFLILTLIIIAIFSINVTIILSFSASTKTEKIYSYSIKVFGYLISTDEKPKNSSNKRRTFSLSSISRYKKHIDIENIIISGSVSLGRADFTAVACGIFYSLSGILCVFLETIGNSIKISQIRFTPVYTTDIHAEIFFECILKFNLGNIIIEKIKMMKG